MESSPGGQEPEPPEDRVGLRGAPSLAVWEALEDQGRTGGTSSPTPVL